MGAIPLEITIYKKNRRQAVLDVTADPKNPSQIREVLTDYLSGEGWDKGRWGEFEAEARAQGSGKVLAKVRP